MPQRAFPTSASPRLRQASVAASLTYPRVGLVHHDQEAAHGIYDAKSLLTQKAIGELTPSIASEIITELAQCQLELQEPLTLAASVIVHFKQKQLACWTNTSAQNAKYHIMIDIAHVQTRCMLNLADQFFHSLVRPPQPESQMPSVLGLVTTLVAVVASLTWIITALTA